MDRRRSKLLRPHTVMASPLAGMRAGQSGYRASDCSSRKHGVSLAELALLWRRTLRRSHRCVWDG